MGAHLMQASLPQQQPRWMPSWCERLRSDWQAGKTKQGKVLLCCKAQKRFAAMAPGSAAVLMAAASPPGTRSDNLAWRCGAVAFKLFRRSLCKAAVLARLLTPVQHS